MFYYVKEITGNIRRNKKSISKFVILNRNSIFQLYTNIIFVNMVFVTNFIGILNHYSCVQKRLHLFCNVHRCKRSCLQFYSLNEIVSVKQKSNIEYKIKLKQIDLKSLWSLPPFLVYTCVFNLLWPISLHASLYHQNANSLTPKKETTKSIIYKIDTVLVARSHAIKCLQQI